MTSRPNLTALAAGLISATGFAPLDWWPLLFAALAVLLWLVYEAPTIRAALLRGWLFGVGHFTVGNNWIQHAFDFQNKMPPALGYAAVVLLALYLAIYPAMAMGLAWRFDRTVRSRAGWEGANLGFVAAAAAGWIVTEWLRSVMFTGYPWNPLGVAWLPVGVGWVAAWTGTYALSGLLVLAAGTLFLAATRYYTPLLVAVPLVLLLLLGPSLPRGSGPLATPDVRPRVTIVQPDIGQENVDAADYPERVLARMIALTGPAKPGAPPRLVAWPEGMVNQYIEDGYPIAWYWMGDPRLIRARIAANLGPRDMALIGGNALMFDSANRLRGAGHSVWAIDPRGVLGDRYDKVHLVPYGEYLPMRGLLQPLGLARLVMGDIDFIPGPAARTINVPGFGRAGVAICYEIIFSGRIVDEAHRPDFLFNPSNDAWFGRWGPPEHLAQARMRAIEEGLPILRATPTGISAVIDASGNIVASLPMGRDGAIEAALPPAHPPTLFARLGNWLALIVSLALLALAIANRRFAR